MIPDKVKMLKLLLPQFIHQQFKIRCTEDDIPMQSALRIFIEMYLDGKISVKKD